MSFDIYANGIKVGEGYLREGVVIPAKGTETLNDVVALDKGALPRAWAAHVRNNEKSTVEVRIVLDIRALGRGTRVPLKTEVIEVETDIIGALNEVLRR